MTQFTAVDIPVYEFRRDHFRISTDQRELDLDVIHRYLTCSYWVPGLPKEVIAQAIPHSFCFGLYDGKEQVGFARVITDYTSFAYLSDVFVLKSHQGQGLGTWLMECVMNCPPLAKLRNFFLITRDAHGLYEKFGFEVIDDPSRYMMLRREMAWYRPELAETEE